GDEVLAVASLARAVSGEATLADVGALTWMTLRHVLPCASLALFVREDGKDAVTARYAAGLHAPAIRGARKSLGSGIAGWAGATGRFVLNADPALDLGHAVAAMTPALRSSLTMPLMHEGVMIAVLALYASEEHAYSEDHARLLDLLAPKLAAAFAP